MKIILLTFGILLLTLQLSAQNCDSLVLKTNLLEKQVNEINLRLDFQKKLGKKATSSYIQSIVLTSFGVLVSSNLQYRKFGYGLVILGGFKIIITQIQIFEALKGKEFNH